MSWEELILSLFFVTLITWYYRSKFSYWSSRGIPGPEPVIFLGNLLPFFTKSWVSIYEKWTKEYGLVYGVYEKTKPALVISDAALVKEIAIKKFDYFPHWREMAGHRLAKAWLLFQRGNEWRRSRAIISPSFTASKMKAMYPLIQKSYLKLDAEMEKVAKSDKEVDIKDIFEKFTSSVITQCAFGTEINPFENQNDPVTKTLARFTQLGLRPLVYFLFPNWFLDWIEFTLTHKPSFNYLINLCRSVVKQRKAAGRGSQNYADLLQLMMDAKVNSSQVKESVLDHESHYMVEDNLQIKDNFITESTSVLSEDEIVANSLLFFAAGYETTATALNFSTYFLTKYPEVQEKLYQEVKDTFGDNEINYETLTGIPYLDAFISETLRFLPPVPVPEREAAADVVLSNGLKVEKGTYVRFPIYTIHHNPEYFPEPEEFRVERFLPENRDKIIPGSYLPFVIGPRNCIGMRFALMEIKMALAKLILKYKFIQTVDILKDEPKFIASGQLLTFRHRLKVKVESRGS